MWLGFNGTRLAAARWFKVSGVGKTTNRAMQSRSDGNSSNSRSKLTDYEQHTSQVPYDEFHSLSAGIRNKTKGKRKPRLDLDDSSEQKPKEIENIVELQQETSTSISHWEDTNMHMKRRWKQSSMYLTDAIENEPFDIKLPEGQSSVMEKNGGEWVQKVKAGIQSVTENDRPEDNVQRNDAVEETGLMLRPGMVLFKRYISMSEQVNIVNKCRELGCAPGGFYRPGYNDGAKLRLYMMCLGLNWDPQTKSYGQIRRHDNVAPPAIPHEFSSVVSRVLNDSHALIKRDSNTLNAEEVLPTISPDVCIVNFYTTTGRLGLHQDRDESTESLKKRLPVVSISIGDSAEFLYGDTRDVGKATCEKLESGDVLIFGGESRHIFHGVKAILPGTAPSTLRESTNLKPGRLNLTFRKH